MVRKITKDYGYGLTFQEYSEKYADFIRFEREDGVLTVQLHTNGGPCKLNLQRHHALGQAWIDIGRDPDNEVVILTGTNGEWLDTNEHFVESGKIFPSQTSAEDMYQIMYANSLALLEKFFHHIEVPTIAALSTAGLSPIGHNEVAYACDLVLCSDTTTFGDVHFGVSPEGYGIPAGDGQALVLEHLIGPRRAAHLIYTGTMIDAQTALEWGLVNEVHPIENLLPRCKEIAHHMIKSASPVVRRLQAQMLKRHWKQRLQNDFPSHITHELFGIFAPYIEAMNAQSKSPAQE